MISCLYWLAVSTALVGLLIATHVVLLFKVSAYKAHFGEFEKYSWVPWLVAFILCCTPLVYEYPGSSSIYTFEGGQPRFRPWGTWEWNEYVNMCDDSVEASSRVKVIAGDKLLDVKVTALCRIVSGSVYYSSKPERQNVGNRWRPKDYALYESRRDISNTVSFWITELCNDQDVVKVLKTLYNPGDPKQQDAFSRVALAWLNERLKGEGMEASDIRFDLNVATFAWY